MLTPRVYDSGGHIGKRQPGTMGGTTVIRKLHLYLIKPSQYDEEGYVVRHWRGVLPSNTLACLAALTQDAVDRRLLGESLTVKVHLVDESVQRVHVRQIARSQRMPHTLTVVCLAGVQTNQFPRAADLAMEFRRRGLTVMMGGFHVSGYLALLDKIPPEIQSLLDGGVTIVKGEVEDAWAGLLRDALAGRLKPLYDFLSRRPDLHDQPVPLINRKYLRRFVASNFGTLDCGRGCPFQCTFCTIINVQGRTMRFRSAARVAQAVRENYRRHGISFYFFTDDNFARNRNWEAIFDALRDLREVERIPVQFMMQVDALSWKIPQFVEKARRAGCTNVFIGMESLNADNLQAAGKRQNRVEDYQQLIAAYHAAEISTHVAYIIGFPYDSVDSVHDDMERLRLLVKPDHASFFMLVPLPGSQDHVAMLHRGEWMDPDFNFYDSHHAVARHPKLSAEEWRSLYLEAWRGFYSFENMKEVLQRAPRRLYWNHLMRFMWYKNAILTEGRHPMMCGWFRRKSRTDRRPGFAVPSRWQHLRTRMREVRAQLAGMLAILLEMEELWLRTRQRSDAEKRVTEELHKIRESARGRLRLADLQLAHLRARLHFPELRMPSKFRLLWARWYPLLAPAKVYTRADLDAFWSTVKQHCGERRWLRIPPHAVALNMFRDAQLALMFVLHLARAE